MQCVLRVVAVAAMAMLCSCAKTTVSMHGEERKGEVSVSDFGTVGDGETDDTAAIQRAIDAVGKTGGAVTLPAGKFLVAGNIKVAKGVAVVGVNRMPMDNTSPLGTVIL